MLLLRVEFVGITLFLGPARARGTGPLARRLYQVDAFCFRLGKDGFGALGQNLALVVEADRAKQVVQHVGVVHCVRQGLAIFVRDELPHLRRRMLRLAWLGEPVVRRDPAVQGTLARRDVTKVRAPGSDG